MLRSKPENLYDAYTAYCSFLLEGSQKKSALVSGIQTALTRFTLPKFDPSLSQSKKLTQEEVAARLELMKTISLAQIDKLLQAQEDVFERMGDVKSKRTYRMHLRKFIKWCRRQSWSLRSDSTPHSQRCPRIRQGRRIKNVRVTNRQLTPSSDNWLYGLQDKTIPAELWTELEKYFGVSLANSQLVSQLKQELTNYYLGCSVSQELQNIVDHLLVDPTVSKELKKGVWFFLELHQITPQLRQELENFFKFMHSSVGGRKRQDKALRRCSATGCVDSAKRQLGVLHNIQGIPLEQLELKLLVPSNGLDENRQRDDDAVETVLDLVEEHCTYMRDVRKVSPNTELKDVEARVAVAKFLYCKDSKRKSRSERTGKRVGYRDIPIIEALREVECEIMDRVNTTPKRSNESVKWLDWEVFKACVEQLYQECAPRDKQYKKRSDLAIAQSYQAFLIFALLSAFPDRQRTIRELEEGRTLVKREGKYCVIHNAEDFKTGDAFCKKGEQRVVELPEEFTPLFDEWFSKWRPILNPKHSYVFTQKKTGKPLKAGDVYNYFRNRAYRLTGQAFTPHLVRDSIVTYMYTSQAPDAVLAALAYLMAHSQVTQRKLYDHRTVQQKVAPAMQALQQIPIGALPAS